MKILKNIFELNKAVKNYKNVGFVPTMGGIHKGHVSLIKISQKNNKETIVSISVNPTQFNQKKDFKNYPKNIKKDISILKKLKVNYLFLPEVNEIYKNKMKNFKLNKSDKILCAKYRKGHFEGVLNVMNRLLSIVKSKHVYMGEKDFQQFMLIKRILGKKYKINDLSKEVKEIIRGLQIAETQLKMHEDTLKLISISRNSLANQLREKLKNLE